MLPIVDTPTIQYIVEEAIDSGIEDIIIVTGRGKRAIEDHFDKSYELEDILAKNGKDELLSQVEEVSNLVNIHYIRQKEPLGLGHAIYCARSFIGNEPFAVMLGDDIVDSEVPCLKQMIDVYNEYRTTVVGVQHVPMEDVSKYGIVECKPVEDRVHKVKDMVEKPSKENAPSDIAILGRYVITPRIFDFLEKAKPGKGGEIQLTDALRELIGVEAMYAYDFVGKRYDVGNKIGFLQATIEFALKREDIKDEFVEYLNSIVDGINK
jgi:UTP--glucose-1-phosphate uridylyltransferase